ncbi:MAG: tetratricopeptide repeat protein [Vicinamibacterales bacterium]
MAAEPNPPADAADTDFHARVSALFEELADLPAAEQERRLAALMDAEAAVAARVDALLRADRSGSALLDQDPRVLAAELAPDGPSTLPQQFGHYVISGYLGEGGMGSVYLARRDGLGDVVAVKFLHDAWSPAARDRFASEQRTLASLNHPSIARLFDAGVSHERPWFAMEYVAGRSLVAHATARGLDLRQRLDLFSRVCQAVSYAHRNLVVHLDLKPSNILVTDAGDVKLVDFGVARHLTEAGAAVERTATGHRRLSLNYASPEQIRGDVLDVQSDVHALGALLYELLTGRPPVEFAGLGPVEMARALVDPPVRPSVRAAERLDSAVQASRNEWQDLDAICLTAVHRDKVERYASAEALLGDLERFERHEPLLARTLTPSTYRIRKYLRRNRRTLAIAGAVAATILALSVGFTLRLVAARDAAVSSRAELERIHRLMLNLFDGDDTAAGPSGGLRVAELLDRGVREAEGLDDEPDLQAELRSTFGGLYHKLGHVDRAGPLLGAALDTQRARLGADDPRTLRTQLALAALRAEESSYDEAERLAREALRLATARAAADPVEVAAAQSVVGRVLADRGDYAAAAELLRDAIDELSTHPPSPELSEAIGVLANTEYYLGHAAAALDLNSRALALDRSLFGSRHPYVAIDLFNLGNLALDRGDYAGAEALYRDARTINEEWYGPHHPKTAQNVLMLGRTLAYLQRPDEAGAMYVQARDEYTKVYGARHPRVAAVLSLMGDLARDRRRFGEAEAAFQEAAAIFKGTVGEEHEFYLHQLSNLGSVHLARGAAATAEPILRDAVRRLSAVVPGQRYTAIAHLRLGRALAAQQRLSEARDEVATAHDMLGALSGSSGSELAEARELLASIYVRLGEPAKAAALAGPP